MSELAIQVKDLSKTFPGGTVAVNGLDMSVPPGVVYGLIGRNGAGKTTALRMLLGLLRPNRGTARVLGADMWTAPRRQRARVAYVSQTQQLHAWMTAGELCHYASHFYETWDAAYARRLAERWELDWQRQVGLLSAGEQRKVSILLALAARAEVLILDEPAAGLDPVARRQLIDEIVDSLARGDGCTVLFSTHIITDLERVAEHVGIMDRGRILTQRRLEDFQTTTKRVQVVFDADRPPPGFAIPGAVRSQTAGPVVTAVVQLASDSQLDEIRQMPGARVNVFDMGLEEAFIELLGPMGAEELTEVRS